MSKQATPRQSPEEVYIEALATTWSYAITEHWRDFKESLSERARKPSFFAEVVEHARGLDHLKKEYETIKAMGIKEWAKPSTKNQINEFFITVAGSKYDGDALDGEYDRDQWKEKISKAMPNVTDAQKAEAWSSMDKAWPKK